MTVVYKLPRIEILIYGLVWSVSIFYSIYCVYCAGKLFDPSALGDDFSVGWHGYIKDTADYEWTIWLPFILYVVPIWILAHILLTEAARLISPQGIPAVHCFITLSFLVVNFSPACAVFAFSQVLAYFVILRFRSIVLVWMFGLPFLLLSCFMLQETWDYMVKAEDQYTMMVVSTTWLHLHCTSFSLDMLSDHRAHVLSWRTFYDLLGYSLYFPTYFLGPFIIYSNFSPYVYRPFERWTKQRVGRFLFNLVRYLFWAAVTEGSLYFLYIHALQFHMSIVAGLGEWTFYGLGFLIGQFFCMKYIVVYGLAGTVANFEGYVAPPPPKCVARIHLYTDMWRVFDVGFYQFMHKYVYTPLCAGRRELSRRVMVSAICFCFVFVWHGVYLSVFIWSVLNFLGVSLVSLGTDISRTSAYKDWQTRTMSEANSRRLTALISAPMFIMGPTSSFYFFSGATVGTTYVNHLLFNGSWTGLITLVAVSYCMCQVSIELKSWEAHRELKLKSK